MLKINLDPKNLLLVRGVALGLLEYVAMASGQGTEAETKDEVSTEPTVTDTPDEEPTVTDMPDEEPELHQDKHGVAFNPEFVGKATKPFYEGGKRDGQWKKKRGVSDKAYGLWYSGQLLEQPVKTAAAFTPDTPAPETGQTAPSDVGAYMLWVSEQQAAGRIAQEDIAAAYAQLGITINELFTDPSAFLKVYEILNK